jgi:hypothetical protein
MRKILITLSLCSSVTLVGCSTSGNFADGPVASSTSTTTTPNTTAISGAVHGGNKPVAGAHIHLMMVATTGYAQASTNLLTASATGNADAYGAYVLSDASGNYSIPSSYSCSGQDQVYLYATGGNAGPGANSAIGLLSAIGGCPLPQFNGVVASAINEVTTVGTAYAIAGFATDATHVSSSGSTLARQGVRNAFANAANLYSSADGSSITTTPAGNGTVPNKAVNTLANILSACIESSPASSPNCQALLSHALNSASVVPTDTANAMLNIAHSPGANIAALYSLGNSSTPFSPALPAQPNDFSLGINYTGGGLNKPSSIAIDGEGNAWIANLGDDTISKLSPAGATLSPSTGFTNGTPIGPVGIALDLSGNAWVVNAVSSSLIKYAASGALLSPSTGYNNGGLAAPQAIASDALGNTWVANFRDSVSKISNGGVSISPGNGYTGGGITGSTAIAIDASGNAWVTNAKGSPNSITRLSAGGQPMSPASGYTGGGINKPFSIAVDGSGYVWTANYLGNSISKIAPNGDPVSPSTGYTGGGVSRPFSLAIDGGGNVWVANDGKFSVSEFSNIGEVLSPSTGFQGGVMSGPQAVAVDGSGNVWVANQNDISVTVLVGACVPVVTPLVVGVKNNLLGQRP